jgi:hypothetical protein
MTLRTQLVSKCSIDVTINSDFIEQLSNYQIFKTLLLKENIHKNIQSMFIQYDL